MVTIGRRFGNLAKGGPKQEITKDGKKMMIAGRDLDHFRFVPELEMRGDLNAQERTALENQLAVFKGLYGEQPRRFTDVALCGATPAECFDNNYELWKSNRQIDRRCDGVTTLKYWTREGYRTEPIPCMCQAEGKQVCRASGRIGIMLTKFSMTTGELGYFMLDTGSEMEIDQIRATLEWAYRNFGPLDTIPFVLDRMPKDIPFTSIDKATGEAKPASSKHWMITLSILPDWLKANQEKALAAGVAPLALPVDEADVIDVDDMLEIDKPVTERYMLSDSDLRGRFFSEVKRLKNMTSNQVQAKLKAAGHNSMAALDWYQACEIVGIEAEPFEF